MRTYDDLSQEEKKKFHAIQLFELNGSLMTKFYMYIILILMFTTIFATILGTLLNKTFVVSYFCIICTLSFFVFAYFLIESFVKTRKMRTLIFGVDHYYEETFGITEKQSKTTFRDVLKVFEEEVTDSQEKHDKLGK